MQTDGKRKEIIEPRLHDGLHSSRSKEQYPEVS